MKILIIGATGMVGSGALLESLRDPSVTEVTALVRSKTGRSDAKLKEIIHNDFYNYERLELTGLDACFFCLGTPSAGKAEADYTRITYDLTMSAAEFLAPRNPQMTFIYISGAGADSSEKGSVMWARVRGRLENALMRLPFKSVYIFRPGVIQALDGIQSKTKLYNLVYKFVFPIVAAARAAFPNQVASTRSVGRALINVARRGAPVKILGAREIEAASKD